MQKSFQAFFIKIVITELVDENVERDVCRPPQLTVDEIVEDDFECRTMTVDEVVAMLDRVESTSLSPRTQNALRKTVERIDVYFVSLYKG